MPATNLPAKAIRRSRRVGRRASARAVEAIADVHRRVGPDEVALTFDDGPDPTATPAVLDRLASLDVRATFFCVGSRVDEHPELVRRMVAEGHAVGSHSHDHPEPWTLGVAGLLRTYRAGRHRLEAAVDRPCPLFRPPKGHLDLKGAAAARASGLRTWLWTLDPEDWRPDASVDEVVTNAAGLGGGDVVLLHDAIEGPLAPSALDRTATVAALDGIVERIRAAGLRPVTLG